MQQLMKPVRSPIFWGVSALALIAIIGLVVTYIHVSPPTQKIITFYTQDAVSITPGDTVRIAGVVVGTVKDLSIEPNQVRVRASLEESAFIGDQSQVEVRMLTVVGGYYVHINSLGNAPLGSRPIPKERVTMPYSLIRTLADATKITENVSTRPINESLNQLQQGLTGTNPDALTQLINAGNSITDAMERQRGQVSRILNVSNEYIRRMNADRAILEFLISRIAILQQTLTIYGKGFSQANLGIGEVGQRLDSVSSFYMFHRRDFIERVRGIFGEIQAIADRNGVVVRVLRRIRERMERTIAAQDVFATQPSFGGTPGPPELFATDLCIPVEGSRC